MYRNILLYLYSCSIIGLSKIHSTASPVEVPRQSHDQPSPGGYRGKYSLAKAVTLPENVFFVWSIRKSPYFICD